MNKLKEMSKNYDENTEGIYANTELRKYVDKTLPPALRKIGEGAPIAFGVVGAKPFDARRVEKGLCWESKNVRACGTSFSVSVAGHAACHGGLRYKKEMAPLFVGTRIDSDVLTKDSRSYHATCGREHSEEFYDFLFNESPWKDAFLTKTGKEAFDSGYVLCRTDVPANVLLAACIASRRVWQYSSLQMAAMRHIIAAVPHVYRGGPLRPAQRRRLAFFMTLLTGRFDATDKGMSFKKDQSASVLVDISQVTWKGAKSFILDGEPYNRLNQGTFHTHTDYRHVAAMWGATREKTMLPWLKSQSEQPCNRVITKDGYGNSKKKYILSARDLSNIADVMIKEIFANYT